MSRCILIVEDEIIIAENMRLMIDAMPGFQDPDIAVSIEEAENYLKTKTPDLILLDIRLGEGKSGIDFADQLLKKQIPFLFITSHADSATVSKAIEKNPLGYVIKPVNQQNLFAQLELAFTKIKKTEFYSFKSGTHQVKVDPYKIVYLKSDNVYTELYTDDSRYVIRNSTKNILDELNIPFVQIHRSYFVNPLYIRELNNSVYLTDGKILPLSRTYKQTVLETVFKNRSGEKK